MSTRPARPFFSTLLRLASAMFLVTLGSGVLATGCGDDTCVGVDQNGQCIAKCESSACAANHECVANACTPICARIEECPAGYACVLTTVDGKPDPGLHCYRDPHVNGTGQGVSCTTNEECDVPRGYECASGTCSQRCETHANCPNGHCEAGLCVTDSDPHGTGQYGTACPDLSGCDEAGGFACVGVAEASLNNYCAKADCATDADCGIGYWCEHGATTSQCVHRAYCHPCETNADCGGEPNQVCAKDAHGVKTCTVACDPAQTKGCPFATASTCAVTDTELGYATCSRRGPGCIGDGTACSACNQDSDCHSAVTGGEAFCGTLPQTFERACIDLGYECSSEPADNKPCPNSPSGLPMDCVDDAEAAGSPLYKHCQPPNVSGSLQGTTFGCWE